MDFATAVVLTLGHEGGLSMDPDDRGNWTGGKKGVGILKGTNKGISAAAYPNEDIANMTTSRARFLYKRDYWDAVRADELPSGIRLHMFDFAVNAGVSTAIRTLQRIGGTKVDGVLGGKTIASAQKVTAIDYERGRIRHYIGTSKTRPVNIKYLVGWTTRTWDITDMSA